jgi:hypothetical protein
VGWNSNLCQDSSVKYGLNRIQYDTEMPSRIKNIWVKTIYNFCIFIELNSFWENVMLNSLKVYHFWAEHLTNYLTKFNCLVLTQLKPNLQVFYPVETIGCQKVFRWLILPPPIHFLVFSVFLGFDDVKIYDTFLKE